MKPNLNNRNLPGKPGRRFLPFVPDELKSLVQSINRRAWKWTASLLILPFLFFSPPGKAQAPGKTYIVNSTGDEHDLNYVPAFDEIGGTDDGLCDVGGGKCTFRAAIENHRKNATNPAINDPNDPNQHFANTIEFDIPLPAGQKVATIMITSFLRPISGNLHIDGTTQPGYDPTGDKIIELNGANAGIGAFALWLVGRGSVVEGLSIHSFSGRGILVSATGGVTSDHIIRFNFIGTDATGKIAKANKAGGIYILGTDKTTNIEVVANLISGNGGPGIEIDGGGATNKSANNNFIHDNTLGGTLGNDGEGILIHNGAKINKVESNGIAGNKKDGVRISGINTDNNIIIGNRIGVRGNATLANEKNGVVIEDQAKDNEIGRVSSTGFGYSNHISGNKGNGVLITGEGTDRNFVRNNQIGTNSDGDAALPGQLQQNGVLIKDKAKENRIGSENLGNLISGNNQNGVLITGVGTDKNGVAFNLIGTDPSGRIAVANMLNGVAVEAGAKESEIGASFAGNRFGNLISGNNVNGVLITGSGTDNNEVGANKIGTDGTGDNPVPNKVNGVAVQDKAQRNMIGLGDQLTNNGNVICGNSVNGVLITGEGTDHNEVWWNFITLPANQHGIAIQDKAKYNNIGLNGITQQTGNGIIITGAGTTNNFITRNAISDNGAIGIDLGNDGPTLNDPPENVDSDTGPNELQNFPEILSADSKGVIKGVLKSAAVATYRIEFFQNGVCDPSGFGEGANYIGSIEVLTDDFGLVEFTANFGLLTVDDVITATATDITETSAGPANNTSEFSACRTVTAAAATGDADLFLTSAANKTTLNLGEQITFTITISNAGPDAATNIIVKDLPGSAFTINTATISSGSYDQATGNWTISSLGSGLQAKLTIVATAAQAGNITNKAEIIAVDQEDPDSSPGNDVASEDDQSSITIKITEAVQTPAQLINKLIDQVNALKRSGHLSDKDAKKLTNHLENALKQVNKGNEKPAINQLDDFIKEVNKLVSKHDLSYSKGQELIAAAEQIIRMLKGKTNGFIENNAVAPKYQLRSASGDGYRLYPAAPNPFNTSTRIVFNLPQQVGVQIAIYDNDGRMVVLLADKVMNAGLHTIEWRAGNLPKGGYVVRLKAGDFIQTQKMIYLK
jgi:uncharacterized repeat protein (TIGR01451 family)